MKRLHTKKLLHVITAAALVAAPLAGLTARTAQAAAPSSPQNLRLVPESVSTDGLVVLTWNAPATGAVAYYQVYRYTGSGTPGMTDLTYVGRTETASTYFIDQAPTEGNYRYAVVAVNAAHEASVPTGWAAISVDLPGNGSGTITPDVTAPAAPATASTDATYKRERTVTVNWAASPDADLWRYLVYRTENNGSPKFVGYVQAGTTRFTDTANQDGRFTYHVIAQDKTGNASASSPTAAVVVDNAAPAVQITAPVNGQTLLNTGSVAISATITENGAGYETSAVKYYLDGALLASPTLNLGTLSLGTHTVKVEVTDRAGNTGSQQVQFTLSSSATAPNAPQSLTAPTYSKSRSVQLSWAAPSAGAASKYVVYRSAGGVTSVAGETVNTSFTDTVAADGTFAYYVVAMNGTVASPSSNAVNVTVDTVAPSITIASPIDDEAYDASGSLPVQVTVSDATSGVERSQVKVYLDGERITVTTLDLSELDEGEHTVKVEATDRAGNLGSKTVTFTVGDAGDDDDDDNDDDDDDHDDDHQGPVRQDLIDKLYELRSQIHHGHFQALLAKARNGNLMSFEKHVRKHTGKFITPSAAKQLLDLLSK